MGVVVRDKISTMSIIFGALKFEISGLIKMMNVECIDRKGSITIYRGSISGREVLLVETGMGKHNVQKAARLIAESYLSSSSISKRALAIGFCGATSGNLQVGDVVLYKTIKNLENIDFSKTCTDISFYDIAKIGCSEYIKNSCKILKVNGGTVSNVIADSELKKNIGAKFDVQAVDMETYWIGKTIIENNLPFCCVRAVSDSVDENIPDFLLTLFGKSILANIFNLLALAIKSPKKIFQITRAVRNIKKAKGSLTAAVAEMI